MAKLRGFIGSSYLSRNPQFDNSRCVNLYPSVDENQTGANQQIAQLLSTPGLTNVLNTALSGTAVRGGFTSSQNQAFFVVDNTLYYLSGSVAPYTPVVVGRLLSNRGIVRFADNGSQMVLVDGPYGYAVNLQALTMTQITDPAFYGSHFVEYYDGYFVFAKPGTTLFYWSDPNATTFNALNFASKSGNADPIAGLVVYLRQLWLIGTQTSEMWYDVGGNVTFQRLAGPYVEQGCGAPDTIAKSEAGVFWLAQSTRGGVTAVMTVGNGIQKVSTAAVDYQLQQYGQSIVRSTGLCHQHDGEMCYQVNPFNGTSSWVYQYTTSQALGLPTWHERTYSIQPGESTTSVPNGTEIRHLADSSWFYNGQNLVGSFRGPNVYALDTNNYTDDGAYIERTRIAPHQTSDGNRIFYSLFRLLAQVGVGTSGSTFQPNTIQHFSNTFSFIPGQPAGNANNVPLGFSDGSIESPSFGQAYAYPLPPPIPSASYQVLSLLNFDDGNNSTAFTDSAGQGVVWTAANTTSETTTKSKYGTGSGNFSSANANNSYIHANAAVGTTLDLVTGQPDWTVESWIYPAGTSGVTQALWDLSDKQSTLFWLHYNGTSISADFSSLGMSATGTIVANVWQHVAVTRNGNNCFLFVNGVYQGPSGVTNDIPGGAFPALSANAQFNLGCAVANWFGTPTATNAGVGYIDDFRITKGRAIYAGNFTPPPQKLTTTVNFPYTLSTLLHFDDGANTFIDSAVVPNIYTAGGSNGTASESSTQAKFGTGSLFLSGSDCRITTPLANNGVLDLTEAGYGQDFTVEYFVYPTTTVASPNALGSYHTDLSANGNTLFQTVMGNGGSINCAIVAYGQINSGASRVTVNAWNHVAVTKKGLKYHLFLNGNTDANGTSPTILPLQARLPNITCPMFIGSAWNSNTFLNGLKNGYIDELRIIKGQAIYTANFAVPNTAFTTLGSPVLPNIGKIVVFQDGLTGNVAQNLRMSVATGGNSVNTLSIDNVSFVDAQSNTQLYISKVSAFSQGANNPIDSTWLWTPTVKSYPAWSVNTASLFTVNYTTGSPGGPASIVSLDPKVRLSWSDDGGYVWSDEIPVSMGAIGNYNRVVEWWRLGYGRNRAFRVRFSEPVAFNLIDAVINAQSTQS